MKFVSQRHGAMAMSRIQSGSIMNLVKVRVRVRVRVTDRVRVGLGSIMNQLTLKLTRLLTRIVSVCARPMQRP